MLALFVTAALCAGPTQDFQLVCGGSQQSFVQRQPMVRIVPNTPSPRIRDLISDVPPVAQPIPVLPQQQAQEPLQLPAPDAADIWKSTKLQDMRNGSLVKIGLYRKSYGRLGYGPWVVYRPSQSNPQVYQQWFRLPRRTNSSTDLQLIRWADSKYMPQPAIKKSEPVQRSQQPYLLTRKVTPLQSGCMTGT